MRRTKPSSAGMVLESDIFVRDEEQVCNCSFTSGREEAERRREIVLTFYIFILGGDLLGQTAEASVGNVPMFVLRSIIDP